MDNRVRFGNERFLRVLWGEFTIFVGHILLTTEVVTTL
jgi:hypothetical protein